MKLKTIKSPSPQSHLERIYFNWAITGANPRKTRSEFMYTTSIRGGLDERTFAQHASPSRLPSNTICYWFGCGVRPPPVTSNGALGRWSCRGVLVRCRLRNIIYNVISVANDSLRSETWAESVKEGGVSGSHILCDFLLNYLFRVRICKWR